nr:MAG TPA: hypothetical protein [Caudoviricetes sp.]
MKFIKRLFCKHQYRLYRTIHGDEANYARSEWRCKLCDKHRYSQSLDKMD